MVELGGQTDEVKVAGLHVLEVQTLDEGGLLPSRRGDEGFQFLHQAREAFERELLRAVAPRLGGVRMHLATRPRPWQLGPVSPPKLPQLRAQLRAGGSCVIAHHVLHPNWFGGIVAA